MWWIATETFEDRHSTFYFRYDTSAAVFVDSWAVKTLTHGNTNTCGNDSSPVFDHFMLLFPVNNLFQW